MLDEREASEYTCMADCRRAIPRVERPAVYWIGPAVRASTRSVELNVVVCILTGRLHCHAHTSSSESSMATPLTLNVKDVLSFFDHISPISNGHVSAVVGVVGEDLGIALLQRCLRHQHGIVSRVITKGGMPITPTNGTGKGHRLDRWLLADASDDHKRTVYQVEVRTGQRRLLEAGSFEWTPLILPCGASAKSDGSRIGMRTKAAFVTRLSGKYSTE